MRTFSSAVQAIINSGEIRFFYLIELGFSSTYRFTSYSSDIVFEGNTYSADGGLYEIDTPKFSSVIDREAYKVVIADLVEEMAAEFETNVVGKTVKVKLGLLDNATNLPLLSSADIMDVYNGFVDAPKLSNDFEEKLAVIECTSPMADLDAVNPFFSSKDGMDNRSSTDTSFDQIFDNKEVSIKWGKV
jgi:hypothetical protein